MVLSQTLKAQGLSAFGFWCLASLLWHLCAGLSVVTLFFQLVTLCWLPPASPQRSGLTQSADASPVWVWSGHRRHPCLFEQVKRTAAFTCFAGPGACKRLCCKHLWHFCSRAEHPEIWIRLKPECQGNKSFGSDDWAISSQNYSVTLCQRSWKNLSNRLFYW